MPCRLALAAGLALGLSAGCASSGKFGCTSNVECKVGSYCLAGSCRIDCRGDFDCMAGHCDPGLGKCVGGPPDGGAPHDLASGQHVADLAQPPSDLAAPPMPLGYGDVCAMGPECTPLASGAFRGMSICSSNPWAAGDRECAGDCDPNLPDDGCMPGDLCAGNATCVQSDVGKSCVSAMMGADCRGGACLGAQGQPATNFCTRVCRSAADCPASYSCSSVGGTRVCVNVDATALCASDAGCIYDTHCDVANRRCLGDCRGDSDCPLQHTCQQVGNRLLCAPKATGGGGVEAPCNSANDCRSGACFMNKCIDRCSVLSSVGQWCPGGLGCNPVDDGAGGFVLLCLAAGTGSLGAPCADNAGCASGLCVDKPGYCARFCNSAPCPRALPHCAAVGVTADGINLMACSK
jgi:hypothetical protein